MQGADLGLSNQEMQALECSTWARQCLEVLLARSVVGMPRADGCRKDAKGSSIKATRLVRFTPGGEHDPEVVERKRDFGMARAKERFFDLECAPKGLFRLSQMTGASIARAQVAEVDRDFVALRAETAPKMPERALVKTPRFDVFAETVENGSE